jgi:single-strand DNA-binding protein
MANKVIFSGYLGQDPETRDVGDTTVTTIRVCHTERWKDKDGKKQERPVWMTIVFWGARGKAIADYRKKGDWIYTEGKIQTRKWEDKEGNDRWTTEIRGDDWEFGPKTSSDGGGGGKKSGGYGGYDDPGPGDDDIPF